MLTISRPARRLLPAWLMLCGPVLAQEPAEADRLRAEVEALLTDFHAAAAEADGDRYFGCLREDAVILGSAPGERFSVEELRALVLPVFSGGTGWKTIPYEQNVWVSEDGTTAWFDEKLLRESEVDYRTSGVLRRGAEGWKLVQVCGAFPVPDERALELAEELREVLPVPKRSIPARSEVAAALEELYRAGAEADLEGYLDRLSEDAVMLGTDVHGRFTRSDIREWLEPYFAAGQRIGSRLLVLRVTEAVDGRFAWFDSLSEKPELCLLRGSGLMRREEGKWRVVHHDLAFLIPNDMLGLVTGPSPFLTPVAPAALREDLHLLRETLEGRHPALYVYETKEDMDRLFDEALARIDAPMTPLEFETLIAPLVARAHCVHTCIQLPGPHHVARLSSSTFLPADPQVIDGRLYVRTSYVDEGTLLEPGAEILRINGLAAPEVIARLMANVPSDGGIESLKLWEVNFRFHLHYATHIGSPERFDLRVRPFGSEGVQELSVPALSYAQWRTAVEERGPALPPWPSQELETRILRDEDLAILAHPTFGPTDEARFTRELREFFARLDEAGIGKLIVDLRQNPGGKPSQGALLVSYLAEEPFTYFRFDPEKNSPFDAFALRTFTRPREPAEHRFRGRIFVLIGGRSTSTAGHVLSLLKQQGRVVMIGQESGATWTCNDNSKAITLPATGIRVKIARTTYQAAVTGLPPGVGVQPDHEVHRTVEDMLAGRDAEMELARRLAREGDSGR